MRAMREYLGYHTDFVGALMAFPDPIATLRGYVHADFGIFVPADDGPAWMSPHTRLWEVLVEARGKDRAADIVAELVVTKGGPRVLALVQDLAAGRVVRVRADDPELAHVLFQDDAAENDLGYFVAEYWERSRGPMAGPGRRRAEPPGESPSPDLSDPEMFVDSDDQSTGEESGLFDDTFTGQETKYRPSAPLNSGMGFEKVIVSQRYFLTADPSWSEQDLEDFIWSNWEGIDYGVEGPLVLFARQFRINLDSQDRVDLLAKGPRGLWYAIELKRKPARSRDLTQLLSYISDLVQRGV